MDPTQPPGQQLPSQQFLDTMRPQSLPPKPHRSFFTLKRIAVIIVVFLIFISSIALLEFQAATRDNFQAYLPTKLPSGIKISNHLKGHITSTFGEYKIVKLTTSSPNFWIGEEKSTQAQYDATAFSCQLQVGESKCTTLKSSGGQSYDVRIDYDSNDKPSTQSIAWLKNGTRFWISLSKDQVTKYSNNSWGSVIDSFKTVSYGSE